MLFHEIYGTYFKVTAEIIKEAVDGNLTGNKIYELVNKKAFSESSLAIPEALEKQNWPLITEDFETPVNNYPQKQLTLLQKRWLKALLSDPRIKLFDVTEKGLEDVEPLYAPGTFVYFDKYSDGDSFEDEEYIANFKITLKALNEKRKVKLTFTGHRGNRHTWICIPCRLEYSQKDDKFRLYTFYKKHIQTINIGRIEKCELLEEYSEEEYMPVPLKKRTVVLELTDDRNALERAMLHFSHFEKETKKMDEDTYQILINYDKDDETEVLIRVLSFGPMIRVLYPDEFIKQIKERIEKQRKLRA